MELLALTVRRIAQSPRWCFLGLFVFAFALRLAMLPFIPRDLIPPNPKWETGAVAISLAQTGRFADPYLIPTGPTAHMPPLQVWMSSLLYRALGVGVAGGLTRWIIILALYSVLWASLPWLGGRLGVGREAGFLAGLAGAVTLGFPAELEPVSAVALILILVAFVRRWSASGLSALGSLLMGLALGIAFHLQPALLPVVLGCMMFELWWRREQRGGRLVGVMFLGILLACVPWGARNVRTFHDLFFIRSNLGLELYVGNHPGAHADIDVSVARGSFRHPRTNLAEAERVRELGEAAYMREKQAEALRWIRDNPGEFLRLTAARIGYFWFGRWGRSPASMGYLLLFALAIVGAWKLLPRLGAPQRAALLIPLATYPLIYYVVAYMPRYGEPVRWLLYLLAGAAVWSWVADSGASSPQEVP